MMESDNDYYIISVENDHDYIQDTVEIYDCGEYGQEQEDICDQSLNLVSDIVPQMDNDYYLIVAKSDTELASTLELPRSSDISSVEYSEDSVGDEDKASQNVVSKTPFLEQYANETMKKQLEECVKKMIHVTRRLPKIIDMPYNVSGHNYSCKYCNFTDECHRRTVKHFRFNHGPRHYRCLACARSYRRHLTLLKHELVCPNPQSHVMRKARELLQSHRFRSYTDGSDEE